jgi:uncharacterized membrane protein SpoIIM required for sporulation
MASNAALFIFGAVQHAGLSIGSFHEPHILPAAIVESTCAVTLIWGVVMVFRRTRTGPVAVLFSNLIAVAGVLLGMWALAAGRGPRTASNDLYHRIMLVLAGTSLVVLAFGRSRLNRRS